MNNYLAISGAALNKNAADIISFVNTPVIAVVKCNGYGIGLKNAADAWYNAGVRRFAVAEPDEAFQLHELGYEGVEILLMSPCYDVKVLQMLAKCGVVFTVTSEKCAVTLAEACSEYGVCAHVKIDTGMGRYGVKYNDFEGLLAIYRVKNIEFKGIFSHFGASFEKKYDKTKLQLDRFNATVDFLKAEGIQPGVRHIANSCAALRFPQTRLDAVRVGSALVGRLITKTPLALEKVGVLRAQAVDEKLLDKGDCSGYAMIYKARRATVAAVIAAGFRSGLGVTREDDRFRMIDTLRSVYHSLIKHGKPHIVKKNGSVHRVLGRIGNQFTLVDNSDNDIKIGDYVDIQVNTLLVDSSVERIVE